MNLMRETIKYGRTITKTMISAIMYAYILESYKEDEGCET